MDTKWECKECSWSGYENELDYEQIDGCVGDDKLEICPKCGSNRVFIVFD